MPFLGLNSVRDFSCQALTEENNEWYISRGYVLDHIPAIDFLKESFVYFCKAQRHIFKAQLGELDYEKD